MVICVFVDLKKAFDTVSHSILLSKLEQLGVQNQEFNWFRSYLSDHKQYLDIDRCTSQIKNVNTGVPQGSLLGVILFQVFIDCL